MKYDSTVGLKTLEIEINPDGRFAMNVPTWMELSQMKRIAEAVSIIQKEVFDESAPPWGP